MTRALRWSFAARRDLIEIWSWRGRDRAELGDLALDDIQRACRRLLRFPYLGPAVPRLASDARKFSVGGYLVFYRVETDAIFVVRVLDQRRLIEAAALSGDG